ncbi:MAG TPA: four-carbon acid sugar kinase family protein, partial [Acetobacteraceae bacterium]|nr:four-carbon acid sugar kinase family protein [Acetobacteraceae bacterium]
MQHLRLIADDLTGALDTAAQFTARMGPLLVYWPGRIPDHFSPSAAIDSGTREEGEAVAALATARLAPLLAPAPDTISYVKLDSQLRGHQSVAVAAVIQALAPSCCIIAPAFPFQRRITRGGLQYVQGLAGWVPVGENLSAALAARGIAVSLARPGDPVPEGVSLWDAETEADMECIAASGLALGQPLLWCGSAGLAG